MKKTKDLGLKLQIAGFAVEGYLTEIEAQAFLQEIVNLIGMTPYGQAFVKTFPTPEGLGGEGETVVQPFFLQPLVESFTFSLPGTLAYDSYRVEGKNGFYLLIASCKYFNLSDVEFYLARRELRVIDRDTMSLKLGDKWALSK